MEENRIKRTAEEDLENSDSFITKVTDFFIKLMDKFTKGKYNTLEEQAFFADEKNLYDEKGNITPEYQKKIEEFEDYVRKNSVDDFLLDVHSKDSKEFGLAYDEGEKMILKQSNAFIADQVEIQKEIEKARMDSINNERTFDFDKWFDDYSLSHNLNDEERKKAKEYILDTIGELQDNEASCGEQELSVSKILSKVMEETK